MVLRTAIYLRSPLLQILLRPPATPTRNLTIFFTRPQPAQSALFYPRNFSSASNLRTASSANMTTSDTTMEESRIPDTLPSQKGDESHTTTTTSTAPQDSIPAESSNDATNPTQGTKRYRAESDTGDADRDGSVEGSIDGTPCKPISKNQMKRLRRQQAWEDARETRKVKRKEKRAVKQARKRTDLEERMDAAKAAGLDPEEVRKETFKPVRERRHNPVPVAFILDCDFERYMLDHEVISLSSQVVRSYSMNKMARYQAHMYISSFGGKMKERFENVLASNHKKWKHVQLIEGDFVEAANLAKEAMAGPKAGAVIDVLKPGGGKAAEEGDNATAAPEPEMEEGVDPSVVYLTADSPYTLERLEANTSYVIGGIVDRNREKGLCYERAADKKVRTAKLPIGEYMAMNSRFVLTTNQVVEIMARWLERGDWGEAFLQVIPQRKAAALKSGGSEAGQEDSQDIEDAREREDGAEEEEEAAEEDAADEKEPAEKAAEEQVAEEKAADEKAADEKAEPEKALEQITVAESQS